MESQDQQALPEKEQSANTSVASAAKTAATAVKSAAKAASGDVAGALKDLAQDENIRRGIVAIIIGAVLISIIGGMMMGSAITGTVESLKTGYLEAYNELYEQHAIAANGSTFALYTFDSQAASEQAMSITIGNFIKRLFKKSSNYDNNGSTTVDDSHYDKTLQAVKDQEAFIGTDGAIQSRLEMIKGRVEQRGKQIEEVALNQYSLSGIGMAIGAYLDNLTTEPILFAGVDTANSSIEINTRAFELSDVQALKILAAYSVQNDCNLRDIDMWDLMNYCGWYGSSTESVPTTMDTEKTIYDTEVNAQYGMEIGGVVSEGQSLSTEIQHISPPRVPHWDGSCAPQWYYEEIAYLRENNRQYKELAERGTSDTLQSMTLYQETSDGDIDISKFTKLSDYDTFGIIDQIYTTTSANVTINRTEYHGADEWLREALSTMPGAIRRRWEEAFPESTGTTGAGNTVHMDREGNHTFTLYGGQSGRIYYLATTNGSRTTTRTGTTITFSGLKANTTYNVYECTGPINHPDSQVAIIDSFTTFTSGTPHEAYKIQVQVNVNFGSRSIEELVEDILGLWPGSLAATDTGTDGRDYAAGHSDNELLAKTWTDTYTNTSGQVQTVEFSRKTGYQKEAYKDFILAIAKALGIDTTAIFGGDLGYGESIVELAKAELEYYQASGLWEGGRYWDMVYEATGARYPATTPWCVCFVMTCAWQCSLLGEGNAWEGVDWIYYCDGLYNELINNGVAQGYASPGSDYKPAPGDIVFFNQSVQGSGLEHVGLVVEVTEDGKLITIEGNKSDILRMDTYSSYRLGTHAYSNCVIAAYCHPNYPATFLQNPLYETIPNSITPSISARLYSLGGQTLFLAGMGRFRWSQIPMFLDALKAGYSELYDENLQAAYDSGDQQAFISFWNNITRSSKKELFKTAQRRILNQKIVQPLAKTLKSQTGFDWKQTSVREQILIGIVTTTDNQQALISVLSSISSHFDNNVGDAEFLETLHTNNFLYNYMLQNRSYLWPTDGSAIQEKWCIGIQGLLEETIERKDEISCFALEVNVTHYCACKKCCGPNAHGVTASGKRVAEGMIATSSYWPFGTKFRINGILYTVEDRGGYEIENSKHRVDIYVPDHNQALQMGRYNTTAYVYPVS